MCHQFLCAACEDVSWDFCYEASAFHSCPYFSQTPYVTDRRCKSCEVIGGAIDELGFWLARHPQRALDYNGPMSAQGDTISEKSFTDSEEEEVDKKVLAKSASPWGCESMTTLDDDEGEEKEKENIEPKGANPSNDDDKIDNDNHAEGGTSEEEEFGEENMETEASDICMGLG